MEKKLTVDNIRKAVKKFGIDTFREEDRRVILRAEDYVALVYRIDDQIKIIDEQKAEIERLTEEKETAYRQGADDMFKAIQEVPKGIEGKTLKIGKFVFRGGKK